MSKFPENLGEIQPEETHETESKTQIHF